MFIVRCNNNIASNKVHVVKVIHDSTGMNMEESKKIVDRLCRGEEVNIEKIEDIEVFLKKLNEYNADASLETFDLNSSTINNEELLNKYNEKTEDGREEISIGDNKNLLVPKSDLFYAPIKKESYSKRQYISNRFFNHLKNCKDINSMFLSTNKAEELIEQLINYYVDRIVSFNIFEYDSINFKRQCGDDIDFSKNTDYILFCEEIEKVLSYEEDLKNQREIERASRSRWEGGGFGLEGAIKGAMTAGALNATTGFFRGIGDGITNMSDKSEVKSKFAALVNDGNRIKLQKGFEKCLLVAEITYIRILSEKLRISCEGCLLLNKDEGRAKYNVLEKIQSFEQKEKVFMDLLSNFAYMDDVIKYALTNYAEYSLDLNKLLEFAKKINHKAYTEWMESSLLEGARKIVTNGRGANRVTELINYGIVFNVIDNDNSILDERYGPEIIMLLIESELDDYGIDINNLIETDFQNIDITECEKVFDKIGIIGMKYHIIENSEIGNFIVLSDFARQYDVFIKFINDLNIDLKKICKVRDVDCASISEAVILTKEWEIYDAIYEPIYSYAYYDSKEIDKALNKLEEIEFQNEYLCSLIEGENGPKVRKRVLIDHEKTIEYEKGKEIINKVTSSIGEKDNLFIYGQEFFMDKLRIVNKLNLLKNEGAKAFPIVIYIKSLQDSLFEGFIITEKNFYNYNSMLGLGFGDKIISLSNVVNTSKKNKKRTFVMDTGKKIVCKIPDLDEEIIRILTDVFNWQEDITKVSSIAVSEEELFDDCVICSSCSKGNRETAKFCRFCGKEIIR